MEILIKLPGILSAIIFHELAHGYTAYYLGDSSAKESGRLSLNPLKHIDPVGFIAMLVLNFGWAKPVPVNSSNFKNKKSGMFLVALAGPIANYILASIFLLILVSSLLINTFEPKILNQVLQIGIWYNIMLGTFNLLPFPPLDGSKIVASLLPSKIEYYFYKYEKYLQSILFILVFTRGIDKILTPLLLKQIGVLNTIIYRVILLFN